MSEKPADDFQSGYYERQYRSRLWRRRGDHPTLYRTLLRTLKPWRGGRLLDVGCGEGQFLRRCAGAFDRYGIDISEEGVRQAQQVTGLATIQRASLEELPFDAESFEVVTCLDVVEHLPRPEVGVAELHRVLARGGCLVLSTPNPQSLGSQRKGRDSHIFRDSTHISIRPVDAWRRMLREAGFAISMDGTDTLWDAPYYRHLRRIQWAAFLTLAHAMRAVRLAYPWRAGENYVCVATKV